jgi:hypothetical protein
MDKHEIALEAITVELKQCQTDKKFGSCSVCEKYLECSLRREYVSKVYLSMNKDKDGGFEF